jgi:hypothetical protein
LERAQGYLHFSDGQTFRGFSDRYKRHGATTLCAALEVATGRVTTERRGRIASHRRPPAGRAERYEGPRPFRRKLRGTSSETPRARAGTASRGGLYCPKHVRPISSGTLRNLTRIG